jgi:hypothetical protein
MELQPKKQAALLEIIKLPLESGPRPYWRPAAMPLLPVVAVAVVVVAAVAVTTVTTATTDLPRPRSRINPATRGNSSWSDGVVEYWSDEACRTQNFLYIDAP